MTMPLHTFRAAGLAAVLALGALTAGCPSDGAGGGGFAFEDSTNADTILNDFVDQVVVPTYDLLATRAAALQTAAEDLQTTPDDTNLAAAQAAWVAMREPWESSEGFLFGPVDANGFDPALDTWPVNVTDLDAVLAGGSALTPAFVAALDTALQGFHTAEYLLFGVGASKTAAELTARELAYLVAVTTVMADVAGDLADAWTTGANPYGDVVRTAGDAGNFVYPSQDAAAQEIVAGMAGILDEVANGKIADPFDLMDTTLVESQFSFNSLTDFTHNVMSAENAYLGRGPDGVDTGVGLDAFVMEVDPNLDLRVKAAFSAALTALGAIPEPFRDAILDPASADEIEAAQEAIRGVHDILQGEVLPLVS